ncbi:PIN domain-containing protein [Halomarina pelagica]|uniref:PIN domain-containing protein n=1 Tax=Halomarina pelagica TaxID=2961599 RepID=UPI0020C44306|nr:PIN domain-containing protein [Halomarina sp. BND7]
MLLDSTFLIDLIDRDPDAKAKLDELAEASTPVAFSVLTAFEVGVGLHGTDERERYERIVAAMTVVPLGRAATRRAISIQRTLRSRGEEIGSVDALIAGTAAERDENVLTRNVDEFERVGEIAVETH